MGQVHTPQVCAKCGAARLNGVATCVRCGHAATYNAPSSIVDFNAPLTPATTKSTLLGLLAVFSIFGAIGAGIYFAPEIVAGTKEKERPSPNSLEYGTPISEVREILGEPDKSQQMHSSQIEIDYLYYGEWQLAFQNGRLESKNRY